MLTNDSWATASAQEPNCARSYTVVPGDTCNLIGAKTNTPTLVLRNARSLSRGTHIIVGSFQIQRVNADKIDAGCDNLFAGEVNSFRRCSCRNCY